MRSAVENMERAGHQAMNKAARNLKLRRKHVDRGSAGSFLVPSLLAAEVSRTKDIIALLHEKMQDSSQNGYYNYEVVYSVGTVRKQRQNKRTAATAAAGIETSGPGYYAMGGNYETYSRQRFDRYLFVLRKNDNPKQVNIVQVARKENDLEQKLYFDLSLLRSVDYGTDDYELVLSLENDDHSIHFVEKAKRDETLFVLSQVYKSIQGKDLTIGYSVDVDAIAYMMSSSGALASFPSLQKLISLNSANIGDHFNEEEAEAERILDELQWGNQLRGVEDIHKVLGSKSQALHHEIIDFLLQWEEMDEGGRNTQTPSRGNNQATNIRSSFIENKKSIGDTKEVLNALNQVYEQLGTADKWLEKQIEHLSAIQDNLNSIEKESGGLETSWQHLNTVLEVVTFLVEKYSMEEDQVALLQNPDRLLSVIFKSNSLHGIELRLQPLVTAAGRLKDALNSKVGDVFNLTSVQWKQIQAISAVNSQKKILSDLATNLVDRLNEPMLNVTEWLLKHKALIEGEGKPPLLPKQFGCRQAFDDINSTSLSESTIRWKYRHSKNNVLLQGQESFHFYLRKFLPLVNILQDLAPLFLRAFIDAYARSVHERFYSVLLKNLMKEISGSVPVKHPAVGYANSARFRCDGKQSPNTTMRFGRGKAVTVWRVFEVALILLSPAMEAEEKFVQAAFGLQRIAGTSYLRMDHRNSEVGSGIGSNLGVLRDFHHDGLALKKVMEIIFDGMIQRLLSISSTNIGGANTAGEADGVEAIALLSVLESFRVGCNDDLLQLIQQEQVHNQQRIAGTANVEPFMDGETLKSAPVNVSIQSPPDFSPLSPMSPSTEEQCYPTYCLAKLFQDLRDSLQTTLTSFRTEQLLWLGNQKYDAKSAAVAPPFAKFPSLISQIYEMMQGKPMEEGEKLMIDLATDLFNWLNAWSKTSDKYHDKLRITNYSFFVLSVGSLHIGSLQNFVALAQQQLEEAQLRYLKWMVEYEFPALATLANRLEGFWSKVSDEDLSLYIRRKDVLNVLNELEVRTMNTMVSNLRKRVEKHFRSDFDPELQLVKRIWLALKDRVIKIFEKLESAASKSYQMDLTTGSRQARDAFDSYIQVDNATL